MQAERERQQISKETTFDDDLTLAQCQPFWPNLISQVWRSLERKQLNARGVSAKLKLKNFQVLQHSKRFNTPLSSPVDLEQALLQLLEEMRVPEDFQFRLIGIGVYQLAAAQEEAQLSLL